MSCAGAARPAATRAVDVATALFYPDSPLPDRIHPAPSSQRILMRSVEIMGIGRIAIRRSNVAGICTRQVDTRGFGRASRHRRRIGVIGKWRYAIGEIRGIDAMRRGGIVKMRLRGLVVVFQGVMCVVGIQRRHAEVPMHVTSIVDHDDEYPQTFISHARWEPGGRCATKAQSSWNTKLVAAPKGSVARSNRIPQASNRHRQSEREL